MGRGAFGPFGLGLRGGIELGLVVPVSIGDLDLDALGKCGFGDGAPGNGGETTVCVRARARACVFGRGEK